MTRPDFTYSEGVFTVSENPNQAKLHHTHGRAQLHTLNVWCYGNGHTQWHYTSFDPPAVVETTGYFNEMSGTDFKPAGRGGFQLGDEVHVSYDAASGCAANAIYAVAAIGDCVRIIRMCFVEHAPKNAQVTPTWSRPFQLQAHIYSTGSGIVAIDGTWRNIEWHLVPGKPPCPAE